MIVPEIGFQIFYSVAELGAANLSEVSNWQAVTQNLGVGLLSDIFRISDFFWKLGVGLWLSMGLYSAHYSICLVLKVKSYNLAQSFTELIVCYSKYVIQ